MKKLNAGAVSNLTLKRILVSVLVLTLTVFSLPQSPSVAADSKTRIPRALNDIPRPSELTLGLAQIQYRGYFADDTGWFSDERYGTSLILNSTTGASGIPFFDWYSNPEDWNKVEKSSWSWTGHFIPDVTGEWQFEIASDDASYMWLGNDAVTNYASSSAGALINNGGVHTERTASAKITLVKDQIYPLRIQYGNNGQAAVFKFRFKSPGVTQWQSDFTTLLWRASYGASSKACGNFGLSYSLSLELGYGDQGLAEFCKKNGADPATFKHNWINMAAKAKPQAPAIKDIKLTTSGLVIEVALGSVPVSSVYLLSPVLGFSNTAKLMGKISDNSATFLVPTSKLKKLTQVDFNIFSSNSNGTTSTNRKAVPVPVKPANTVKPSKKPTPPSSPTLICTKGDKSRPFAGKVCPPGWTK